MAKHTPEDDNSFQLSLIKHVGAAVALVVVVAAAFWGIGEIRAPEGDVAVDDVQETGEPARSDQDPSDLAELLPEDGESPTGDATTAEPTETQTSEQDAPSEQPTEDQPSETSEPEPTATATETSEPEPTESETDSSSQEFAPSQISVQVLDAVIDDGGETAKRVFDQLDADGYRAVARNQAVKKYSVTTVMYTPGNEAKARQIAAQYGYRRVEAQPGNLSNSVDVHLVVGADA